MKSLVLIMQNLVVKSHVRWLLGNVLVCGNEVVEILLLVLGLAHYRAGVALGAYAVQDCSLLLESSSVRVGAHYYILSGDRWLG